MSLSLSFPDQTYTAANEPSVETLKADLTAIETEVNAHENLTTAHGSSGAVVGLTTLQAYVPAGVIFPYGGASAPTGFLLCDGSAVSRSTYATLFAVVGESFGVGDGGTTFNLPDLRDKFPIGKSATKALGATGGAATATIAQANLPNISTAAGTAHTHTQTAHTHIQNAHQHTITGTGTGVNVDSGSFTTAAVKSGSLTTDATTATNQNTTAVNQNESAHTHSLGGSGTAMAILNPYVAVNYIIKT